MFRILLGKRTVESIAEKTSKYIAEKSAGKSSILEESKLLIEKEKLELERAKLDATFKTSQTAANAVRYAANLRALTSLGTAGMLGAATWLYLRPMEKELKEHQENLQKKERLLRHTKSLFIKAESDLQHTIKILKKAENNFVYTSPNVAEVKNYENYKTSEEQQRIVEIDRYEGQLEYESAITNRKY